MLIMGGLVDGNALGAAFHLLFDTAQRVVLFSSEFNRLKSTLCLIKQAIDDVDTVSSILNRTQQEAPIFARRLLEGEKLIRKCSRVKRLNVFKRWYYSIKLSNLESSLVSFFQLDVAALHYRESKRISAVVSNLEGKIDELTSILHTSQIVRRSSNSFSKIVAGFEDGESADFGEITAIRDR